MARAQEVTKRTVFETVRGLRQCVFVVYTGFRNT